MRRHPAAGRTAVLALALLTGFPLAAAEPRCEPWAARIVAVEGRIQLIDAPGATPRRLRSGDWLCPGEELWVLDARAALRLPNETVLRLDQGSVLRFAPVRESVTVLELLRGVVLFFTRTPRRFEIQTPYLNAAADGTEFLVQVGGESTRVVLWEGSLELANAQGQQRLAPGQAADAPAGAAPRIRSSQRAVREAVAWALYYPPVLAPDPARYPEAARLWAAGDALGALEQLPPTPGTLLERASLSLLLGRVADAAELIDDALQRRRGAPDALALRALVALVQGRAGDAARDIEAATESVPGRPAVLLARSYLEQSRFQLPRALAAARAAAEAAPGSALAQARVAELALTQEHYAEARRAARRAVEARGAPGRAHTVQGFAELASLRPGPAADSFRRARQLLPQEPLAALGLGLARIRQGSLVEGRELLELAVALDPGNALWRSYLGKAYYAEARNPLAEAQYRLARDLDAADPTPWLYGAILAQAENRPVQAARRLDEAAQRSASRAVYRSRLLLDRDAAALAAAQAQVYRSLGLEAQARRRAMAAAQAAPTEHSGHRLLAEAYAGEPGFDNLRAVARLQAVLRQPLGAPPLALGLDEPALAVIEGAGPSDLGWNEYTPLFEADGIDASLAFALGSDDTRAHDAYLQGQAGRVAGSVSSYRYRTDGWRTNADADLSIHQALLQVQATPGLGLQLEARRRDDTQGDVAQRFFEESVQPERRESLTVNRLRAGGRWRPVPGHSLAASFIYRERDEAGDDRSLLESPPQPPLQSIQRDRSETRSREAALRYDLASPVGHSMAAGWLFDEDGEISSDVSIELPLPDGSTVTVPASSVTEDVSDRHTAVYAQHTAPLGSSGASATLGLQAARLTSEFQDREGIYPRAGLRWERGPLSVHGAWFRALQPPVSADGRLEPASVAGIPVLHDDFLATESRGYGLGLAWQPGQPTELGALALRRDLDQPIAEATATGPVDLQIREDSLRVYWNQGLIGRCAGRLAYRYDLYRTSPRAGVDVLQVTTRRFPVGLQCSPGAGVQLSAGAQYVDQELRFNPAVVSTRNQGAVGDSSPRSRFWSVDAGATYRLPRRAGSIALEVRNLLDRDFRYFDENIKTQRPRPLDLVPERVLLLTLHLAF